MCYWDKKPCFRQKWPTKSTFTFYRTKNPTNTIRKSTSGSFATESSTSADAFSPPDSNSQVQIPGKKNLPNKLFWKFILEKLFWNNYSDCCLQTILMMILTMLIIIMMVVMMIFWDMCLLRDKTSNHFASLWPLTQEPDLIIRSIFLRLTLKISKQLQIIIHVFGNVLGTLLMCHWPKHYRQTWPTN